MDPISIIVTALAIGAANGLKDVAEKTVQDAYAAIKESIRSRYKAIDIDLIEKNPESVKRQSVLEEELTEAGAGADEELLERAKALIEIAKSSLSDETMSSVGVEIREVEGGNLEIRRIHARGKGVEIIRSKLKDITVTDVDARGYESDSAKKKIDTM